MEKRYALKNKTYQLCLGKMGFSENEHGLFEKEIFRNKHVVTTLSFIPFEGTYYLYIIKKYFKDGERIIKFASKYYANDYIKVLKCLVVKNTDEVCKHIRQNKKRNFVTKELVKEMALKRESGKTLRQIGKELDFSHETVRLSLKNFQQELQNEGLV